MQRPTPKEIDKRLSEAKQSIEDRGLFFACPGKAVGELYALEVEGTLELKPLLICLLQEISILDYAGSRPPQRSYESSIANVELWAFSWSSALLNKEMYLKFAIKGGCFYYVSLHESRLKEVD